MDEKQTSVTTYLCNNEFEYCPSINVISDSSPAVVTSVSFVSSSLSLFCFSCASCVGHMEFVRMSETLCSFAFSLLRETIETIERKVSCNVT